jgi:Protein of unknown function (DUF2934)
MAKHKKSTATKTTGTQTDDFGSPASPGSSNGDAQSIDRERVASRAYELYVARGGRDGQDVDDWLTAERELSEGTKPRK